ncbi:NAD(P)-dependent oxidoreductase [Mycolicibacter terrae]|uniref:dTDP-4-dehydrorhamnose reductase n=2 Tax=Mycolicibacter terrae TaxID=1788 RepID=A0AAD1MH65_9MYCO|nr:dTDP-4-dehydrorhamnose reductase [Mycolicibacter terrae]ORW98104.1 NAD(P)-dependent oxidoreductase [Mycolicibacter terrae]BBX21644.1 NAD(P)-dependent oxidoreductase [Mycolicibacter terrae]SNV87101.1 dTDP-6-deoxy-L-lyxo-4-hexulose reductase RmlD [Mycolicibacter terrae]
MTSGQRIVITGAGGQVGSFLAVRAAETGHDVLALSSAQCDITDPAAVGAVDLRPGDVLVNCAAYTDVDSAETDADRAHAVNAAGPGHVATACARAGARLIHISTDYVFGGDFGGAAPRPYEPGDATRPLSVYGSTKLAGEDAVLTACPDALVVRTAWVYTGAAGGSDFVAVMRERAAGDSTVEVVDDQIGSPTYVGDLVDALLALAGAWPAARLLHAANGGAASRYEQARAVFAALGADPHRVLPVSSAARPRPAARPAYSALSGVESARAGLAPLRPWSAALAAALAR